MKLALFSDIRGDLQALQAVLRDAQEQGCTSYACLGDITGEGPESAACVDLVRSLDCPVVRGDFDEGAASDTSLDDLNPTAQEVQFRNRTQLSREQRAWLAGLPLVQDRQDFTIAHASLDGPGTWVYTVSTQDVMASFYYQHTPVCFIGHTLNPRIFEKSGSVRKLPALEASLTSGFKYMVDVGSVRQRRYGDVLLGHPPSYAIYDIPRRHVQIRSLGENGSAVASPDRPPLVPNQASCQTTA